MSIGPAPRVVVDCQTVGDRVVAVALRAQPVSSLWLPQPLGPDNHRTLHLRAYLAMTSTLTKVTSLGSHSENHSVPFPTPVTEALYSDVINPPPPMDFAAVTRILAPITESLNEKAEEAILPSPPLNTPVIGSPAPSVTLRSVAPRLRGFSGIGDRLAKLKIEGRISRRHRHHGGTDMTSSTRSAEPSVVGECDECEMASVSEVMSEGCKDKGCPGHARSPTINPRIEEYLSFTSKDLPNQAPAPVTGATLAQHAQSTSTTALDANSLRSRVSFKSDGVTEKSNWADDVEDGFDRICLRLEQLADDEHNTDPSKSPEEYYIARINRLLCSGKRQIPVRIAVGANAAL
ncbi:hypothetical protein HBH98_148120 [Parastagonospora nodorum]|nr:hypothetical protein HBH54_011480 [Parastagonospora nodorum]KAH3967538.1 hypothetical protein HBH51_134940 [Parastagonospora nodorum]KAH3990690.1 hypothetical protein HBH52_000420 [Parastagonospora nodorum]KAH4006818.1 hypothetical protein HBI10_011420 [Parastagonospora nodorum]KAH4034513.1 hypothetical protein HBI09_099830 [Parastagonospora nodorum]